MSKSALCNYSVEFVILTKALIKLTQTIYTGCNRRNGPNFGRVFLMLNYTEKNPKHLYPKLNGLGDNGN